MPTDSYGSARWANEEDLSREGFGFFGNSPESQGNYGKSAYYLLGVLADPKVLLADIQKSYEPVLTSLFQGMADLFRGSAGRNARAGSGRYIGWSGNGHLISIAPTRSGKGVGLVIPNLLNYRGSTIIIDPKGENYAITAAYRKEILGQTIIKLDPFGVCKGEKQSVVNPLYQLNTNSPDFIDDVNMIVDALVLREKDEKDPHWNDKAKSLVKALVMAVLCDLNPSRRKHLGEARRLLTSSFEDFIRLCQNMANRTDLANGLLSWAGNEILAMGPSELSSVVSTAMRHTEFLDSPRVLSSLSDDKNGDRGDYILRNLKSKGKVSIYIILPPHLLARYSRLVRLWISSAMAVMTRTQNKPADGLPVLFMLDEMAQLGRMEQLIQAVSLQAGYGMSMWMIWQDIGQLKALYPDEWSSFLANARIQQYFGVNDPETAKYISEMLGSATISVHSTSTSKSSTGKMTELMHQKTTGESTQTSEKERHLLMIDEIRRLNRKVTINLIQGCPPLLTERIEYFSDPNFTESASPNPYL